MALAGSGLKETDRWQAKWCWTRKHLARPWNTYCYFRRVIELAAEPRRAIVRVSADARYVLYVNGRRVHQGPARSAPQQQAYDTLDLAEYLEAGTNTVCAVCHQFGVPTFFSQYRDASGFILDGSVELDPAEQVDLHTPDGWLCREAKGWRKDVARQSVQMGFQEHFDADADPGDWMAATFEADAAGGWAEPWVAGPAGVHPWAKLEPRVPLLADHVERFASIVAQFHGENARGYKIAEDVYHLPAQEVRRKDKTPALENPQAMLADDDEVTTVPPAVDGESEFHMVVLDLGTYRTGHLMLDIAEAAGDEIIDIIYSEELDKAQAPMIVGVPKPGVSEEATASRYRCRPGAQRWETFHYVGMRYATLIFRNVEKPLKVRGVALRQVHAALDDVGRFECSDERLTQIWAAAKNTQLNCAFDALVDCPWREQAQWWGDARIQARVIAYAFGDTSLVERGIRQVARSQAADGSLHAHPPADIHHRLPDFMMTWVGSLWDHYFYTGRKDLARECLPAMHRLFEFFKAHEVSEGLVGNFDGFWVFLDWAPLRTGNFSSILNLMYLQGLRWAAALCHVLGETAWADRYQGRSELLGASCQKHFWDATTRTWRDGFDPATGAAIEETSQHAHAMAMLLRLKPETHPKLARDVLLKAAATKRGKVVTASPFFYAYVLEALAESGFHAEVVDLIREKWGAFVDRGATTFPEGWETTTGSFCHAWSASPLYFLSQEVLGVVPVDVGWKQVRIAPKPAGLDFARGVVPSPLGPIRVEWEKGGEDQLAVRVDLPAGMTGEFVGPLGESRSLDAGPHEFHT